MSVSPGQRTAYALSDTFPVLCIAVARPAHDRYDPASQLPWARTGAEPRKVKLLGGLP